MSPQRGKMENREAELVRAEIFALIAIDHSRNRNSKVGKRILEFLMLLL